MQIPELVGHGFAAWPATVDLYCFGMYLEGASAADCTAAHLRRLQETHKLPKDFFSSGKFAHGNGAEPATSPSTRSPVLNQSNRATPAAAGFPAQPPAFRQGRELSPEATQILSALPPPIAEYLLVLRAHPEQLQPAFDEQLQFFRTLENDEGYFEEPSTFVALRALPVHPIVRRALIERYYALDDDVIAACLGRRLSKNDVDPICDHFTSNQRSDQWIRRQVECLRRVYKTIVAGYKKNHKPGGVERGGRFEPHYSCTEAIKELFKVNDEQARVYGCAVFAVEHELGCEPFTRMPLDASLLLCASTMEAWCSANQLSTAASFRVSMSHFSRMMGDLVVQRDLVHLLGTQVTSGPIALAMKMLPASTAVAPPNAAAISHSAPPSAAGSSQSTPQVSLSSQAPVGTGPLATWKGIAAVGQLSTSFAAATVSPPPPGGAASALAQPPSKWKYSAWLQAELIPLFKALSRVTRVISQKEELCHGFQAMYAQIYEAFICHPEGGTQVIALIGRIAECLAILKPTPDIHGDVMKFVVVLKLTVQLLLSTSCSTSRA
jgi:hypothetical protein